MIRTYNIFELGITGGPQYRHLRRNGNFRAVSADLDINIHRPTEANNERHLRQDVNHLWEQPRMRRGLRVGFLDHWPHLLEESLSIFGKLSAELRGKDKAADLGPSGPKDDGLCDVGAVAADRELNRHCTPNRPPLVDRQGWTQA